MVRNIVNRGCAAFVIIGTLLLADYLVFAAEDQVAQYEKQLSSAKRELEQYKKNLTEGPAAAAIKKEIAELDASVKAKDKELAALLDSRLEKNTAYLELAAKVKELERINSELKKFHDAVVESDPGIKALQKEAQDLRVKAVAKEREARKLIDSKLNSDQNVKGLLAKKAPIAGAGREKMNFTQDIMNDPQIKAIQAESADLKRKLSAKANQLRNTVVNLLKTDVRLKALELRVTELNKQISGLRKVQKGPARIARPQTQPPAKTTPQGESLVDKIKRKIGQK